MGEFVNVITETGSVKFRTKATVRALLSVFVRISQVTIWESGITRAHVKNFFKSVGFRGPRKGNMRVHVKKSIKKVRF